MTHNRKPRFIEPTLLPQWALIIYQLEALQDVYLHELMTHCPNDGKLDYIESEMKAKDKQLQYQNFKFN